MHDDQFYTLKNPNFHKSIQNIVAIQQFCIKNRIQFKIFTLPYAYPLAVKVFPNWTIFEKELAKQSIQVTTLSMPQNGERSLSSDFLYGDGIHFSAKGHQKIAQQIQENYR